MPSHIRPRQFWLPRLRPPQLRPPRVRPPKLLLLPLLLLLSLVFPGPPPAAAETPAALRARILDIADRMLDEAQVSYVYGGHRLGDPSACQACNTCLETHHPRPSQRLRLCPQCSSCSLDCSHFLQLVYTEAGAPFPYLDTATMLSLSPAALLRRYRLVDLGQDLAHTAPGDLLVYKGHVVMLERLYPQGRGDVIHATGGKDIKRPGEGIQRERFADLAGFRGPLLRILRHAALVDATPMVAAPPAPEPAPAPAPQAPLRRLRPVVKRSPGGDDAG